jgi:hypothetical protein
VREATEPFVLFLRREQFGRCLTPFLVVVTDIFRMVGQELLGFVRVMRVDWVVSNRDHSSVDTYLYWLKERRIWSGLNDVNEPPASVPCDVSVSVQAV